MTLGGTSISDSAWSFFLFAIPTAIMEIIKNLLREDIPLEQNLFRESQKLWEWIILKPQQGYMG